MIKAAAIEVRERARLERLARWARASGQPDVHLNGKRVGILAGYGNTSYGDYFIGLGMANETRAAGFTPVIIGRDSDMRAFLSNGIEVYALPDRDHGLDEFEDVATRVHALILGGGGLFEDRVDAVASQTLAAGYAARAVYAYNRGVPMAVHGVGIEREPYALRGTERLLRNALRAARMVSVRDADSVEACKRFGVDAQQAIDPAVIYLDSVRPPASVDEGTAAFIPFARRAWPNMSNPTEADHQRQDVDWAQAADRLTGYNRVLVTPFHRTDLNYVDRIVTALKVKSPGVDVNVVDFTPENPGVVLNALARCEHVLTMRYHGFMAAHFAGVPTIEVLGESQKLRVTNALNQQGVLQDAWNAERARKQLRATLGEVDTIHTHISW
ncbi:polysaccharide pyruvyl transferase family protein [Rhodococcus sp. DMU2021]|uniref:polysaccharide pyruvyl transferase family protein n=1 Tax=Rhodococcus sp. DMU2021 TaxID=2866997 RepID=UPI001C7D458A|nr:polysaccharide pyruvyl transferase family protein [Rhodococcus sp. DMU2021]MBX4168023.1 polysaccharide pyruvyl transferase family protein [Rhodococcus sp. DMU2021]